MSGGRTIGPNRNMFLTRRGGGERLLDFELKRRADIAVRAFLPVDDAVNEIYSVVVR